jgi:hypothetical protein
MANSTAKTSIVSVEKAEAREVLYSSHTKNNEKKGGNQEVILKEIAFLGV